MKLWIAGRPNDPLVFSDHKLAESIIDSPVRIYKVEVQYQTLHPWWDITSQYYEQINATFEYWRKMNMKIKTVPKYSPGEVVDLTYKNGGLPNRIIITCSFWRQGDKRWMYKVFMESTGEYSVLDETFISARASKKTAPVYKNPDIMRRISEGWRFCGNFEAETALANGKLIAENEMIKNVRLYPALDRNNQFLKGQNGIWIIYKHTISNDGEYLGNDNPTYGDIVDIK